MTEDVQILQGERPGPTSILLVGVHGNETCGPTAPATLLPSLEIQSGKVIIAYGNPRALAINVRMTETNLNRMFKPAGLLTPEERRSYEYRRAQFLKPYLDQAGALLDVHSSNSPGSEPFVICEANAAPLTPYLPTKRIVYGFDAVQPGGTDYYMNQQGKIGICLECGYTLSEAAARIAQEGILAFLRARGHIAGSLRTYLQTTVTIYQMYVTQTPSFRLEKAYADFESIAADQIIGYDGQTIIRAPYDGVILFARACEQAGKEAFLLGTVKSGLNK